ncbi:TM1266 family iron-only hydrogenase system putative regulator [Guggenheimella bovis]
MEKRIAIIGIIIEDVEASKEVNEILHAYGSLIEGRMGLPRVKGNTSVMSIICLGSTNEISALSGKLGQVKHVSTKTLYGKSDV